MFSLLTHWAWESKAILLTNLAFMTNNSLSASHPKVSHFLRHGYQDQISIRVLSNSDKCGFHYDGLLSSSSCFSRVRLCDQLIGLNSLDIDSHELKEIEGD